MKLSLAVASNFKLIAVSVIPCQMALTSLITTSLNFTRKSFKKVGGGQVPARPIRNTRCLAPTIPKAEAQFMAWMIVTQRDRGA